MTGQLLIDCIHQHEFFMINVVLHKIGDVCGTMWTFHHAWLVKLQTIKVLCNKFLNDTDYAENMLTAITRVMPAPVKRSVDDSVVFLHVLVALEQCMSMIRRKFL